MPAKKKAQAQVVKLLYGREEAAYALGISLRSVDTMIAEKLVRARRFGRRVLIPVSDIQRVAKTIEISDMLEGTSTSCADPLPGGKLSLCPTPKPKRSAESTKTPGAAESGGASTSPQIVTASA